MIVRAFGNHYKSFSSVLNAAELPQRSLPRILAKYGTLEHYLRTAMPGKSDDEIINVLQKAEARERVVMTVLLTAKLKELAQNELSRGRIKDKELTEMLTKFVTSEKPDAFLRSVLL